MESANTFHCPVSGCSQSYISYLALQKHLIDSFDFPAHIFAASETSVTSLPFDNDALLSADSNGDCDKGRSMSPREPEAEMKQIEIQKQGLIPNATFIDGVDEYLLLDQSLASDRAESLPKMYQQGEACEPRQPQTQQLLRYTFLNELDALLADARPGLGIMTADCPEVAEAPGSIPRQSALCPRCTRY